MELATPPRIRLVDDLRSFVDGRAALVARTNAAGVELLEKHRDERLDELWLDAKIIQVLPRWGYHVRSAVGSPELGHG